MSIVGDAPGGAAKFFRKPKVAFLMEVLRLERLGERRGSKSSIAMLGCFPSGISFAFKVNFTAFCGVWGATTVFFFLEGGSFAEVCCGTKSIIL